MKIDDEEDMRCAFAAFALQGLVMNIDPDTLEDTHIRFLIAQTAFDMADMMMRVKNERTRH